MATAPNKVLAIAITIIAVTFGGIWIIFVVFMPEKALLFINNVEIKYVMILVGNIGIILLGIFAYYILHMPRPRRLVLSFFQFMLVTSTLGSSAPLGLSAIEGYASSLGETSAWFDIKFAGPSAAVIFVCGTAICYLLIKEYRRIAEYEKKNGILD